MSNWIKQTEQKPDTKRDSSAPEHGDYRQSDLVEVKFRNGKYGFGRYRQSSEISAWFTRQYGNEPLENRSWRIPIGSWRVIEWREITKSE